jgi:hypothetical protein
MKRASLLVVVGIAAAALWALFRPELLFVDRSVSEALPAAGVAVPSGGGGAAAVLLASGTFHDGAHTTRGSAAILELPGGERILRLTDFETSNGPDVRVLLIAARDATDDDGVERSAPIELGKLKGNLGDQNYPVPAEVDLARYRAVAIWCHRFGVNFGAAPLEREAP